MMKLYLTDGFRMPLKTHREQHELGYRMLHRMVSEMGICERTGDMPLLAAGAHGKPYFPEHQDICFNISHCPQAVVVVMSDSPVGVDVQQHFAWKDSLAGYILHAEERDWLKKMQSDAERENGLNLIWSLKESFLKCTGEGITRELAGLNMMMREDRLETPEGIFRFTSFQNKAYTLCTCEKV